MSFGDLVRHQIVPEEVVKQAGISEPRIATLCIDCRNEIQAWNSKRVSITRYDNKTKLFVPKSPAEIVKEYIAAYMAFTAYKKRR
ncbi:MAG: hypothetical protein ACE5KP_07025 [Dehalococcoidales bacterium]